MTAILRAENLVRRLDDEAVPVTLVKGVDFSISRGEFVAVMGPSGSGKSSLLYLLGLLDRPTEGKIWIDNLDATGAKEEDLAAIRLEKIGFVFQFHYLLPEFSALENLEIPMRRLGRLDVRARRRRGEELLDSLGLADHRHKLPSQMSGGQRQRVAIARALANDPPVLLTDEPTGNLDSASSANVRGILAKLAAEEGKAVVAVTHDEHFATGANRIVTLVDGRIDLGVA